MSMKLNPSWFLFFTMNLLGIMLVMSSNNWYMIWMGFELSLLGFLPMITSASSVESMIKYFLVQAGGSALYMFSFLVSFKCLGSMMVFWAMVMKLGIFPFYHWMPSVMSQMSWHSCLILTTMQKLPPLFVLLSLNIDWTSLIIVSLASVALGSVLAYNQSHMRYLLAYSSISHMGWLLSTSYFSLKLPLVYLSFYVLMSIFLFNALSTYKLDKVGAAKWSTKSSFIVLLSLMSLSGIPPFPVFFAKVMVFNMLLNLVPLAVLLLSICAVISIYFYLTFIITSLSDKKVFMEGLALCSPTMVVTIVAFILLMLS